MILHWTGTFPGIAPKIEIGPFQKLKIPSYKHGVNYAMIQKCFCELTCINMIQSMMGMGANTMFMCKLNYYGAHPYNQSASRITNTQS